MFGKSRVLEEANQTLKSENETLKDEILSLQAKITNLTEENEKNRRLLHGNHLFQALNNSML